MSDVRNQFIVCQALDLLKDRINECGKDRSSFNGFDIK
jgi:hypothetical protein